VLIKLSIKLSRKFLIIANFYTKKKEKHTIARHSSIRTKLRGLHNFVWMPKIMFK